MFLLNFTTKKKERNEDFFLVERILNGEEKALFLFYRKFKTRIFSYIKKRIDNFSDAEEVLQDTLISSLEALRDYSGRSSLTTYIYGIASHKVVDYYRKRKINQVFFSSFPDLGEFLTNFLGPEDELDEKLLKEKIEKTLLKLKPNYKNILVFKYIYGLSIAEIAQRLSEGVKTVESRLFRARKAFIKIYID